MSACWWDIPTCSRSATSFALIFAHCDSTIAEICVSCNYGLWSLRLHRGGEGKDGKERSLGGKSGRSSLDSFLLLQNC